MAIQLPKIDRIAPQQSAPSDKLTVSIPDFTKAADIQGAATDKLAAQAQKFAEDREDQAIETHATQKANEYYNFVEQQIEGKNGLKYQDGDPTAAYDKFNETIHQKVDEYLSDESGLSERAKLTLAQKLQEVQQRTHYKAATIYGSLYDSYATRVTNDGVDLEKRGLTDATSYIQKDDPNSLTHFDLGVQKIIDLRFKNGERVGTVTKDADGNYIPNPSVQLQVAKDLSEGVTNAVENLVVSGRLDEAEILREKYGKYIDPVNSKKLTKSTEVAVKKNLAFTMLDTVRDMPQEKAMDKIDDIKDPEVRQTVEKLYNDHLTRKASIINNSSKTNYNEAANFILQKQNSGNPFVSTTEMENDPYVSKLLPKITDAKQKKALYAAISPPKESNVSDKNTLYDDLFAGNFKGMSFQDLNEKMAHLNKADRALFEKKFAAINTETGGEENQRLKLMGGELKNQMQRLGLVKKNQYGKYDNKTEVKIAEARQQMLDQMDKFPPGMSHSEVIKEVTKFATALKTGEVYKKPEAVELPPPPKNPNVSKKPGITSGDVDMVSKLEYARQFRKEKGRSPNLGTTELQDFIKSKSGK